MTTTRDLERALADYERKLEAQARTLADLETKLEAADVTIAELVEIVWEWKRASHVAARMVHVRGVQ